MLENYTEGAHRVIFFARYECHAFGSPELEPEHLLLGVLREAPDLILKFLPRNKAQNLIRQQIEEQVFRGHKYSQSFIVPLSKHSEAVLAYASCICEKLGEDHITPDHLLLGLLHEKNTLAERVLTAHSILHSVVYKRISSGSWHANKTVSLH